MSEWIANGAQLGWLIEAGRRAVEIHRPDLEPEIRTDASTSQARVRWTVSFST